MCVCAFVLFFVLFENGLIFQIIRQARSNRFGRLFAVQHLTSINWLLSFPVNGIKLQKKEKKKETNNKDGEK